MTMSDKLIHYLLDNLPTNCCDVKIAICVCICVFAVALLALIGVLRYHKQTLEHQLEMEKMKRENGNQTHE